MRNLSTHASANSSALIRSPIRGLSVIAVVAILAITPSAIRAIGQPPVELLSLQTVTSGTNVRIEVSASGPLADAVIEQSVGARQATIRISGATSQLKPEYSINDPLVHSIHSQTGNTNGVAWVQLVIDIDESAAIDYHKQSNSLIIEAVRMGYFSSSRTPTINNATQKVASAKSSAEPAQTSVSSTQTKTSESNNKKKSTRRSPAPDTKPGAVEPAQDAAATAQIPKSEIPPAS